LVTEYPLPDASAKDPHTLNFDQSGMLWFTVQQANMIGRLDPATGAIKLVTSPTPKSRPYGLKINARGVPVVVEFGTNKIATIDPRTMAIKEYALPNPAARPRRRETVSRTNITSGPVVRSNCEGREITRVPEKQKPWSH